jgi:hypothetical protein
VILANIFVNANRDSKEVFGAAFGRSINITGNIKNVKKRDTTIPALIIQPKFITGNIPLNRRDPKPIPVVKIAKAHGLAIERVESKIN